jgi:hypothetical protein
MSKLTNCLGLIALSVILELAGSTWVRAQDQPATGTAAPATSTPDLTATVASPTGTPTGTSMPTVSPTGTVTPTATPRPSETLGPTMTPTPGATATPLWPTDTPTPTVTRTPTPTCDDPWEPNAQPGSGPALMIDQTLSGLTLYPEGDADFFKLWGKGGRFYQLTTTTGQGVDTRLRVFEPTGRLIAENDDYTPGNPASRLTFMAPGEGWFAVAVDSRAPIDWACRVYTVTAVDVSPPTATPTATPGPPPTATRPPTATPPPTAIPGEVMVDAYEPNPNFEAAANIGVGQTLALNFNPYPAGSHGIDNDFFRLYVKAGDRLLIETKNLAEGLDTNLILYRDSGEPLLGNDDCEAGQRRSCLDWSPDYTGLAYILVGPVGTIPEAVAAGARAYSLVVTNMAGEGPLLADISPPGTPTSAYGQPLPWAVTPLPPTPVQGVGEIIPPTPTPTAAVVVRVYSMEPPPATSRPLQTVMVRLTVYYDENNNRAADASEGVAGLSVRALDSLSNRGLGQAFTDEQGYAAVSVSAMGEVRLSVPYLSYNQPVKPPGKELFIRLTPLRLPSLIP